MLEMEMATMESVKEEKGHVDVRVLESAELRSGTKVVTGSIPIGVLVPRHTVPRRDFAKKTGYQRELSQSRVNQLVKDLKTGHVDIPTAILLNLREFNAKKHLQEEGEALWLRLNGSKLHVVDGQHRVAAVAALFEEDPKEWADFELTFVCMLGASESEEMQQFYVVNTNAKSVRTDLALDLLKQQAENDASLVQHLEEKGTKWKVDGQTIAEQLVERSPLWRNKIRFPGMPAGDTVISSSGMVASLRPLLLTPYFQRINLDNQLKVLTAFWKGLSSVLPEAFETPEDFTIQKGTGVHVMHAVLITVLELLRATGKSVIEPDSYASALKKALENLQGDTSDGDVASGAMFWKSGPEGAAGAYSSNAARRVLLAKIRAQLPEMPVE